MRVVLTQTEFSDGAQTRFTWKGGREGNIERRACLFFLGEEEEIQVENFISP